ncbi:hypothetical protein AB1N83_001276 [Pleurotus pulmonarius]
MVSPEEFGAAKSPLKFGSTSAAVGAGIWKAHFSEVQQRGVRAEMTECKQQDNVSILEVTLPRLYIYINPGSLASKTDIMPACSSVDGSIVGTNNTNITDNSVRLEHRWSPTYNVCGNGNKLARTTSSISLRVSKTIELLQASERALQQTPSRIIQTSTDILDEAMANLDSVFYLIELLLELKCHPEVISKLQYQHQKCHEGTQNMLDQLEGESIFTRVLDFDTRRKAGDQRTLSKALQKDVRRLSNAIRENNAKQKIFQRQQNQADRPTTLAP